MKKIFIIALAVCGLAATAQKKKAPAKKTASKSVAKSVAKSTLAKADALTFESVKTGNDFKIYALAGKDSLMVTSPSRVLPENAAIKKFSAAGTDLYLISWTSHYKTGDAKSKLEDIVETHNEIWNTATKARVFENTQSVNNITEIVWLDPNKTASKTEEKIRRAGMECTLLPDGTVSLRNKAGESKLKFDAAKQQYVASR